MSVTKSSVLAALVQVGKDALTGVQVLRGWNGQTKLDRTALVVGFDPQQGNPVVISTADVEEGSLCDVLVTHTIRCTLATWDGDLTFDTKSAILDGHLNALNDAIDADQSLGIGAYDAWIAPDQEWYEQVQQSTKDSAARATVQVDFLITVRGYRS